MFILRDLLTPLQQQFSDTAQGRKRSVWFSYTLLAVVVPFTSSITSNLLRSLNTLFGFSIPMQRFYTFMGSSTLPWDKLWSTLWDLIPDPLVDGRLIVALDDSIIAKIGRKIFGCGFFHDHAAKGNQSSYPWSQCIVMLGLLRPIKGRWACLPLSFRYYFMKKDVDKAVEDESNCNARVRGKPVSFLSKMEQAAEMLMQLRNHFNASVLVVADSWFGNNGLWSKLEGAGETFHLLSRLRTNSVLYGLPENLKEGEKRGRGRPRKYGEKLGSISDACGTVSRAGRGVFGAALWQTTNRRGLL